MMKRLAQLLFVLLLLPMMPIQAQESTLPLPLAVEYQDAVYVMNSIPTSVETVPVALTFLSDEIDPYTLASWSPDGTKLLYNRNHIWNGSQSFLLEDKNLLSSELMSWTPDGQILYMNVLGDFNSGRLARLSSLTPEADAQPTVLADGLPVNIDCGIGTIVPMEAMLWHEVGIADVRPILALTDYGLIYPAGCNGYDLRLYRPSTGENFTLADGMFRRAALSLDQSRLAGLVYDVDASMEKIVVVDLLTLTETTLSTTEAPAVVTWGDDGSLYYAAASATRNMLDGITPEQMAQIDSVLSEGAILNFSAAKTIRLYRRGADGSETLLHEQDAYAVGAMVFKDNMLIYSTIANGDAWVQVLADGTLTGDDGYSGAANDYVPTTVQYLTFNVDGSVAEAVALPGNLKRVVIPR